jgi:hypothetical protein
MTPTGRRSAKEAQHIRLGGRLVKAFLLVLLGAVWSAVAAEPPQATEDSEASAPRFPSPDGRYAMLVTEDPGGESQKDRVELIELPTKRVLALLSDPEDETENSRSAKLQWSADSRRVAAYTGFKRGGATRIFVRDGDGFTEVKLPALPDLPDEPSAAIMKKNPEGFSRAITIRSLDFVRWLKSGVVLQLYNCWGGLNGTWGWHITITIDVDAQGRATIRKVAKRETVER